MTRNYGWSFLDMGRRLSRAAHLSELLLGIFGKAGAGADDVGNLAFVLELDDSFITYRSRYRMAPVLPLVLDLLLVDESNPRSIALQLAALSRHIDTLPQSGEGGGRIDEQRTALSLLTRVRWPGPRNWPRPGRTASVPSWRRCWASRSPCCRTCRMRSGGAISTWSRRTRVG
jgi:uncharacterized alpha-E superfamily protein